MNEKDAKGACSRSSGDATPTIQELKLAKSKGNQVLGPLLERYGGRIRHWIQKAGVRQNDDIDDLEGDILLKLVEELPATDFDSAGRFRKWVQRVSTNCAIDYLRRQNRNPAKRHLDSLITSGGSGLDPPASQTGALTRISRDERIKKRNALIAKLPKPHRELIEMREQQNMAFATIAEAQNEMARAMGITQERTEDSARMTYNRLKEKIGEPVEG